MSGTLGRRLWFLVGGALLLVVALLYVGSRRPVARISTVRIGRETLNSSIATNGKVEPTSPFAVRAKFDGFVNHVTVMEGQSVKVGQPLLTMDARSVQAQLDQTRAQLATQEDDLRAARAGGRADQLSRLDGDLRTAQSQKDLLQHQQEALTQLLAAKAATPNELAQNRADLERANSDVDRLRKARLEFDQQTGLDRNRQALLVKQSTALVDDLEDKVASANVWAPLSGTLFSLPVHVGDFVHTGDLLADVADLRQVRVRAYIDEPELGHLRQNQAVEVTWDALPDRTWQGQTENVPRQVVARGARNVGELLCAISNPGMDLIPNTTVDVRIRLDQHQQALVVPRGAVVIEGASRFVYRVSDGRLHRTEIRLGLASASKFEVLSGVQEGDVVALPGDKPFRDGMAVNTVVPE